MPLFNTLFGFHKENTVTNTGADGELFYGNDKEWVILYYYDDIGMSWSIVYYYHKITHKYKAPTVSYFMVIIKTRYHLSG